MRNMVTVNYEQFVNDAFTANDNSTYACAFSHGGGVTMKRATRLCM